MSVLGDRYDYDVFFSYAWATKSGDADLRDWSRKVIETTLRLLRPRYGVKAPEFKQYLDRNEACAGQDLDVDLRRAAERSGIFVALISPYYNAEYCLKEVEWFCESLNGDTLADRVCLIRIWATDDETWPNKFKGISGRPLIYIDLCDEHGQPLGFAYFVTEGKLEKLADLVQEIAFQIAYKIDCLAKRLIAQEQYRLLQTPPDRPMYFLEAEPNDKPKWAECSKHLREVPSIVLPAGEPKPATAMSPDDVKAFDGIVMLRSRPDDDFSRRIASAYASRRRLFVDPKNEKASSWIPWALLDEVEPAPPEEALYDIPRIKLGEGDWLENLKQAMRC
jgi:hypothetical protein